VRELGDQKQLFVPQSQRESPNLHTKGVELRKLTTITIASIAGAALVLGGASVATAYPSTATPTVVTSKTTATAGSSLSAATLNIKPGTPVSYTLGDYSITSTGTVFIPVPGLAGKYALTATVGEDNLPEGESDEGAVSKKTITVGKIVTSISRSASTTKPAKGKSIRVSGVVTPKSAGIIVSIEIRKSSDTTYDVYKTAKTTSGGKYTAVVKQPKGKYVIKVTTGDSKYSAKSSAVFTVTFK